jgi:hypothetical protein
MKHRNDDFFVNFEQKSSYMTDIVLMKTPKAFLIVSTMCTHDLQLIKSIDKHL